jgi:hypothetical protein
VFTALDKPAPTPTRRPAPVTIDNSANYAKAALEGEINTLARTREGARNQQLFKSTASLAELVAGGVLNKSEVVDALYDTALSTGLKEREVKSTINSGFRTGSTNPRRPKDTNKAIHAPARDNGSQAKYESKKNADSENPAPYGMNPYTGEVFDERGYPNDWDDIELDPKEELMNRDATFATICTIFDATPITEIKLN